MIGTLILLGLIGYLVYILTSWHFESKYPFMFERYGDMKTFVDETENLIPVHKKPRYRVKANTERSE